MIDPLTSLAFSVHSGRGVYALLLGSGISRSAQIPTGWEVTLDLIRKMAAVEGEDCGPDPAAWYGKKFHKEPDYSDLLAGMALTPSERTNALRGYFEASSADIEDGRKVPTAAHNAIARLVKAGYFKVIITTNFDRLVEQALINEGVDPTVISTSDMVLGATPLAHSSCTVIKVHGDYRDSRLRNTSEELSSYDPDLDKLLDRVFDEYGLIICGWSATWDQALRSAIQRCPNRRYSITWAAKGALSPEAAALVQLRGASTLSIDSADGFFQSLEDKLASLETLNTPHPLSAALAVTSLKRYLVEDRFRIQLNDLITGEVDKLVTALLPLPAAVQTLECDLYLARATLYENSLQILLPMLAYGSYWGEPQHAQLWKKTVVRLLDLAPASGGSTALLHLRRYPALLAFYASGIASVASGHYYSLKAIVRDATTSVDYPFEGRDDYLVRKMAPYDVLDGDSLNRCLQQRFHVACSERLHKVLREVFRTLIPGDRDYDDAFDRFEYLAAVVAFDMRLEDNGYFRGAIGRFGYRNANSNSNVSQHISAILVREMAKEGDKWPILESGLFASSERYSKAAEGFGEQMLSRCAGWI